MLSRCSSIDRHLACSGSIGFEGQDFEEPGDGTSLLGTAVGDAFEQYAARGVTDLEGVAERHGVAVDQIAPAFYSGRQVWLQISHWFTGKWSTQYKVAGRTTMGTSDIVNIEKQYPDESAEAVSIAIVDVKLGMSDDEHPGQLKGYSLAMYDQYGGVPRSGHILAIELQLLNKRVLVQKLTKDDLEAFRAQLERQHKLAYEDVFTAGDWCKYCPGRHECEPRDKWLRASASALVEVSRSVTTTRQALARAHPKVAVLKRAINAYEKALKHEIRAGGPIPDGNGSCIALVEKPVEKLRSSIALGPAMTNGLDIDLCATITKSGLKRAVKAQADAMKAAGQKYNQAQAMRDILGTIEGADGVVHETQTRIEVTPYDEPNSED